MNIAVIHGQMHKGSTYHVTELLWKQIAGPEDTITEFFLGKDAPGYCIGCYQCFLKGEDACPHQEKVQPIAKALKEASIIIVDSPCYVCNMTGQLKTLFDHLAYMWMSHRPDPSMFHKIGVVISTTAGIGAGKTTKCMKDNLSFWGVPKIHRVAIPVAALKWDDVKAKKKEDIAKKMEKLAKRLHRERGHVSNGIVFKILFNLMKMSQVNNDWNPTDRGHWVKNGWLDGKKPWKNK